MIVPVSHETLSKPLEDVANSHHNMGNELEM